VRTTSRVTMRRLSSLDSEKVCDFPAQEQLIVLQVGSGRRLKVGTLAGSPLEGWVSYKTKTGQTLLAKVDAPVVPARPVTTSSSSPTSPPREHKTILQRLEEQQQQAREQKRLEQQKQEEEEARRAAAAKEAEAREHRRQHRKHKKEKEKSANPHGEDAFGVLSWPVEGSSQPPIQRVESSPMWGSSTDSQVGGGTWSSGSPWSGSPATVQPQPHLQLQPNIQRADSSPAWSDDFTDPWATSVSGANMSTASASPSALPSQLGQRAFPDQTMQSFGQHSDSSFQSPQLEHNSHHPHHNYQHHHQVDPSWSGTSSIGSPDVGTTNHQIAWTPPPTFMPEQSGNPFAAGSSPQGPFGGSFGGAQALSTMPAIDALTSFSFESTSPQVPNFDSGAGGLNGGVESAASGFDSELPNGFGISSSSHHHEGETREEKKARKRREREERRAVAVAATAAMPTLPEGFSLERRRSSGGSSSSRNNRVSWSDEVAGQHSILETVHPFDVVSPRSQHSQGSSDHHNHKSSVDSNLSLSMASQPTFGPGLGPGSVGGNFGLNNHDDDSRLEGWIEGRPSSTAGFGSFSGLDAFGSAVLDRTRATDFSVGGSRDDGSFSSGLFNNDTIGGSVQHHRSELGLVSGKWEAAAAAGRRLEKRFSFSFDDFSDTEAAKVNAHTGYGIPRLPESARFQHKPFLSQDRLGNSRGTRSCSALDNVPSNWANTVRGGLPSSAVSARPPLASAYPSSASASTPHLTTHHGGSISARSAWDRPPTASAQTLLEALSQSERRAAALRSDLARLSGSNELGHSMPLSAASFGSSAWTCNNNNNNFNKSGSISISSSSDRAFAWSFGATPSRAPPAAFGGRTSTGGGGGGGVGVGAVGGRGGGWQGFGSNSSSMLVL